MVVCLAIFRYHSFYIPFSEAFFGLPLLSVAEIDPYTKEEPSC